MPSTLIPFHHRLYGLGNSEDLVLIPCPICTLHQTLGSPNSITGLSFYVLFKHTLLRFTKR